MDNFEFNDVSVLLVLKHITINYIAISSAIHLNDKTVYENKNLLFWEKNIFVLTTASLNPTHEWPCCPLYTC